MKHWNKEIIREAQQFAARWGFLTRDIFFDFICPMSRAHRFRYWSHLVSQGYFLRSQANPLVLILSKKSRNQLGGRARPARQSIYVAHDSVAAHVFLSLQKRGLIVRSWIEDELMRNPMDAFTILGTQRVARIPDLIFDLKTQVGAVRCALEIERTTKTQSRYTKLALAYLGYQNISVILFGCQEKVTEDAIRRAFSSSSFTERNLVPGLFQYPAFDLENLQTTIRFHDKEFEIQNFLEIITRASVPRLHSLRDKRETAVSLKNAKNREAA